MTSLGNEARFYRLQPTGKSSSIRKSEEHERAAFSAPCNAIDGLRFTARATISSRSRCFRIFFGYTVYQIEFCLGSEKPVLIYKLSILRASGDRRLPEPFHLQHQTLAPEENSTAVQAMKKKLFILTPASQWTPNCDKSCYLFQHGLQPLYFVLVPSSLLETAFLCCLDKETKFCKKENWKITLKSHNSPFAWWRHSTTKTRMLFAASIVCSHDVMLEE